MGDRADVLRLVAELCEELSHRGRSSLTVVSGALGDLAAGHSLAAEEVRDALSGSERLRLTFDVLREVGQRINSDTLPEDLLRLIASVKQ